MGALERDNGLYVDPSTKQPRYSRPNHSPLSITNRSIPNRMLGGENHFKELVNRASELKMSILIDSLTRVSSSRMDRRYKKYVLSTLDDQGKRRAVYGSDGR